MGFLADVGFAVVAERGLRVLAATMILHLGNRFVSLLQRFGIETDMFSSATGTPRGLEAA